MPHLACTGTTIDGHQWLLLPAELSALPTFTLTQWHAKSGQSVQAGELIAEIEGAKTAASVSSPEAGIFVRNHLEQSVEYADPTAIGFLLSSQIESFQPPHGSIVLSKETKEWAIGEALARHNRNAAASRTVVRVDANRLSDLIHSLDLPVGAASTSEFISWVAARLLEKHSRLNANCYGSKYVVRKQVSLGITVDLGAGIRVPVVQDCTPLSYDEFARIAKDLVLQTARGEIHEDDCRGATFSVSSMFSMGVFDFTPILNVHQCATLGIGAEADGHLGLIVAFDHRFITGRIVAGFLKDLRDCLTLPRESSPLASMAIH